MADLKNIDEAALIESIKREWKDGGERIEEAAKRAIAEVKDARAALRDVPDSALALFTRATAFYSCTMTFGRNYSAQPEILLRVNNGPAAVLGDAKLLYPVDVDTRSEPQKRYRVLVAFLPLPDEGVK